MWWWMIALFVVLLIVPSFFPRYYVYLMASILLTVLLAMTFNLVLGYGGMLHLHFGVFYGIGAYTLTLFLIKTPLPIWVGFVAAAVAAAVAGWITGLILTRLRGLYFGLLSIIMGQLIWSFARIGTALTGGHFGIQNIPMPPFLMSINGSYYFILLVTAIGITILYLIVNSPFGKTLEAIRDNPERSQSIGINVRAHQLIALTIAGALAGVSGSLLIVLERNVSPEVLYWIKSAQILIMTLAGGVFTFWGPLVGAFLITLIQSFVGVYYTEYMSIMLGSIFVLVVLFLPQGIHGYIEEKLGPRVKATGGGA